MGKTTQVSFQIEIQRKEVWISIALQEAFAIQEKIVLKEALPIQEEIGLQKGSLKEPWQVNDSSQGSLRQSSQGQIAPRQKPHAQVVEETMRKMKLNHGVSKEQRSHEKIRQKKLQICRGRGILMQIALIIVLILL